MVVADHGGPLVLDALIYGPAVEVRPTQFDELAAFLAENFRATLGLKALVSVHLAPVTGNSSPKLLRIYLQHQRIERKEKGQNRVPDSYAENFKAFFES